MTRGGAIDSTKPIFFPTSSAFRAWLAKHHAKAAELWVGFYKKDSGKPSITWPESVDQALCYGWIDGVRKSIDATSYKIRFSPRRAESIWSAINRKRIEELIAEGKMKPAGLKAYEGRKENRSGIYSYEQRPAEMVEPYAGLFKKNKGAWRFFQDQPPYYRRVVTWWIVSAKKEETRIKRLDKLMAHSGRGERLPELMPKKQRELNRKTK
jgi:uncharacterized protein YdeI (YjbR/CyaY-like superfamily)